MQVTRVLALHTLGYKSSRTRFLDQFLQEVFQSTTIRRTSNKRPASLHVRGD